MRILVTGGSGQIGGALVPQLTGLGIVMAPNPAEFDLAHPADIAQYLDRISPDLIINSAAYTSVDSAEDERDLAFAVNAESPGAIARWAADDPNAILFMPGVQCRCPKRKARTTVSISVR
jgi:dTDP-4-dehydrorhamnose reductase